MWLEFDYDNIRVGDSVLNEGGYDGVINNLNVYNKQKYVYVKYRVRSVINNEDYYDIIHLYYDNGKSSTSQGYKLVKYKPCVMLIPYSYDSYLASKSVRLKTRSGVYFDDFYLISKEKILFIRKNGEFSHCVNAITGEVFKNSNSQADIVEIEILPS